MMSIEREEPDPKLDLQYPEHWERAGYGCLYPYRPLAAFRDRLAVEEQRRSAEANKRARELERARRQLEHQASCVDTVARTVGEQVAERLSALPENRAFTTRHGNYGHTGAVVDAVQEYGMRHDGRTLQIPFRLPVSPKAPATRTELEVQKLMDRHHANVDIAITGKNAIKRVRAGERHCEVEGFPATDAGIRNAIQNVEYQRKWRRNSPGDGAPAESAMIWLARAERKLPLHASELQRMLGWRKAAAEMKRAEGDISSLRAQLGQRSDDESGARLLGLALDVCYCFSDEQQHDMIHGGTQALINGTAEGPQESCLQKGSDSIVKLLEEGTSVHSTNERGQTCLHFCAKVPPHASNLERVLELIEILVQYGADVDAVDKRGEAPLHYATRCGNADTAWFLLANGASADTDPTCRERTPLHVAAACGHAELASMLLEEGGAEPLAIDAQGRTPKQVAVEEGRERQMGEVLSDSSVGRQQGKPKSLHPQQVGQALGQGAGARRLARPALSTREMNDKNAFRALWG